MTKLSGFWRWPQSSLQRSLFCYVVLPMLLLSGLAIRFGLSFTHELVSQSLRSDLALIGRAIRTPVSDALLSGDGNAILANLESVFAINEIYGAAVYDTSGRLVASTGLAETDLTRSLAVSEAVRTGKQQESYRVVAGWQLYSQFLPVTDRSGRIHGLLQITRRASDFEQSLTRLSRIAWFSWGALALLSFVIIRFGHNKAIGRYLWQLLGSMRRVAQGELQHRAVLSGPAELQEVSRGLNTMLDAMQQTEQQLRQQQLQQQQLTQQLKEQEKMAVIGQLVSGVAHELGAPLTVIDGRVQRVLRTHNDADTERQLQAVRNQVSRLSTLVRQLQAFAYTPVAQRQPLSVAELLQQAIHSLSFELQAEDPQPHLLQPCPAVTLYGDAARLELALVNLLRNAVQAASSNVTVQVAVSVGELTISVLDDGAGLPVQFSTEQLLSPFVSTKAQGRGTGLGLAIVQQIVLEHQGKLLLSNRPQGGCCVRITLPLEAKR
ncbi:HAMP domain-containing sensor histidine kinase [Rheinheimera sp.]|uniref:sensor histidine kinase n=1 Tax=Rheinheimera sp. TaxID=1869214 RepID=UPI00273293B6|nr:HAMP domain-containing sensor histidine kinase [Rheinheimera sp.]MDP2716998.1 HAMP domain-containing sensor histidine kinase [Rheinheimera sp.]